MLPICQVNLTEMPFRPPRLNDLPDNDANGTSSGPTPQAPRSEKFHPRRSVSTGPSTIKNAINHDYQLTCCYRVSFNHQDSEEFGKS